MWTIEQMSNNKQYDLYIRYGRLESTFGRLLIGESNLGICYLGFDGLGAFENMRDHYPDAMFGEGISEQATNQIARFMGGLQPDITFHLRGTAFQIDVWSALLTVGIGELHSYSQIATAIGRPQAVRAVGSAIGRNPVSLLIPCHRILRSDGSMGGYLWGLETKRKLIEWEHLFVQNRVSELV